MKNKKVNRKRNRNKFNNEHLLFCIVMTSTKLLICTVSKKLNEDNEKQALFEERSLIGFLSMAQLKDQLSRKDILCTIPGKTQPLEYRSNSNRKPIFLSKIGLTLKSFYRLLLSPVISNGAYTVLFTILCAGNIFKHEKKYEIGEIN